MLLGTLIVLFVLRTAEGDVASQKVAPSVSRPAFFQPSNPCCWPKPRNCADLYKSGVRMNGVYHVYPLKEDQPAAVYCDMTTDGGGWTVFQKRFNGEVDFYRGWYNYMSGFGSVFREYWWGNDKLHQVTSQEPPHLRIDLSDFDGKSRYAKYSTFGIAGYADKYRASIGGYWGNAGDSFVFIDGMRFSTKGADYDTHSGSCAVMYKGAMWYAGCHRSNLNGLYKHGVTTTYADSMCWRTWRGFYYSLKTSEMKIRPANF